MSDQPTPEEPAVPDQSTPEQPCGCGVDHAAAARALADRIDRHRVSVSACTDTLDAIAADLTRGEITTEQSYMARAAAALVLGYATQDAAADGGQPPYIASMTGAFSAIATLHEPDLVSGACKGCACAQWPCPTITVASLDPTVSAQVEAVRRERSRRWS